MANPYTVILMHPEYADQADNGYCGTHQAHVWADTPEDAVDQAAHNAAAATGRSIGDGADFSDFGFVAVMAGHLDNLYTP